MMKANDKRPSAPSSVRQSHCQFWFYRDSSPRNVINSPSLFYFIYFILVFFFFYIYLNVYLFNLLLLLLLLLLLCCYYNYYFIYFYLTFFHFLFFFKETMIIKLQNWQKRKVSSSSLYHTCKVFWTQTIKIQIWLNTIKLIRCWWKSMAPWLQCFSCVS